MNNLDDIGENGNELSQPPQVGLQRSASHERRGADDMRVTKGRPNTTAGLDYGHRLVSLSDVPDERGESDQRQHALISESRGDGIGSPERSAEF